MRQKSVASKHNKTANVKKGSMTLEVIVVAALVLLVLIVISVIFANKFGLFNKGLKHCDTVCVKTAAECQILGYEIPTAIGNCEDSTGAKFTDIAYCCREKSTP